MRSQGPNPTQMDRRHYLADGLLPLRQSRGCSRTPDHLGCFHLWSALRFLDPMSTSHHPMSSGAPPPSPSLDQVKCQ